MINKLTFLLLLTGVSDRSWRVPGNTNIHRMYDEEMGVACYTIYTNTYVNTLSCVKVKDIK